MSIQKTLGGDRLGSGQEMKVELHNFERSTFDTSYLWRSSMAAGTLVPFMSEVMLPGDTFDINLNADIKTVPTLGPLFGSYKVQLDVFSIPVRLYSSALHNNLLGVGRDMSKIKIPQLQLGCADYKPTDDIDNQQINPSCLLSYLNIRGVGLNTSGMVLGRSFNAIPLLAYWEIFKNYYANKMEDTAYVIGDIGINYNQPSITIKGNGTTIPQLPTSGSITVPYLSDIIITHPPGDILIVDLV